MKLTAKEALKEIREWTEAYDGSPESLEEMRSNISTILDAVTDAGPCDCKGREIPRVIVVTDCGEVVAVHCVTAVQVQVIDTRNDAVAQYDTPGDARAACALRDLDRGSPGPKVVREYFLAGTDDDEEDARCIVCGNDLTNEEEDKCTGYCDDCAPQGVNDDDDDDVVPDCPKCGGPGVVLGKLGKVTHYRCRNCGWDFSE